MPSSIKKPISSSLLRSLFLRGGSMRTHPANQHFAAKTSMNFTAKTSMKICVIFQ